MLGPAWTLEASHRCELQMGDRGNGSRGNDYSEGLVPIVKMEGRKAGFEGLMKGGSPDIGQGVILSA
jgi:hypothetical protein